MAHCTENEAEAEKYSDTNHNLRDQQNLPANQNKFMILGILEDKINKPKMLVKQEVWLLVLPLLK